MMSEALAMQLPGALAVIGWFGKWPSFHDGEVIGLSLFRAGSSTLRVYPYFPNKPANVIFILEGITDIELADFSQQNVISDLLLDSVIDQNGNPAIRLTLGACYGIAGWIDARHIRVELEPGRSSDGVSQW